MPHEEALAEGQGPKCRTLRGVRAMRKTRKTRVATFDSICMYVRGACASAYAEPLALPRLSKSYRRIIHFFRVALFVLAL